MLNSVLFYLLLSFENAKCKFIYDNLADLKEFSEQNKLFNVFGQQDEISLDNVGRKSLSDYFNMLKAHLNSYEKDFENKQALFLSEIESLALSFTNNGNRKQILDESKNNIKNLGSFSILVYRTQILNDICNLYSYSNSDEFLHLFVEINKKLEEIRTASQYNEDLINQTKDKIILFCTFTKNRCTRLLRFIAEIKGLGSQPTKQNKKSNNFLFAGQLTSNELFLLPVLINSEEKIKIILKATKEMDNYISFFDLRCHSQILYLIDKLSVVFYGFKSFKSSESKPSGFYENLLNFMQFVSASLTRNADRSTITEYIYSSTQNTNDFKTLLEIIADFLHSFHNIRKCIKHYKGIYNKKTKSLKEWIKKRPYTKSSLAGFDESIGLLKIRIDEYSSYRFENPLLQDFVKKLGVSMGNALDNLNSL